MSDDDDKPAQSDQPTDRLTELCAEMTRVLDEPRNSDVRGIVFLDDRHRGGIQFHGYDDTAEGLADLFVHMKAIFQSMGKDLDFIGIPETAEGAEGPAEGLGGAGT